MPRPRAIVVSWMLASAAGWGCGRLGFNALVGAEDAGPVVPPDASATGGPAIGAAPGTGGQPGSGGGGTAGTGAGGANTGGMASGGAGGMAVAYDPCAQIPALAAAPSIDGVLEPGLSLFDVVPTGLQPQGSIIPAGQRAAVAIAWRVNGLYAFLRVWDSNLIPAKSDDGAWCGDGVEIYVDDDGSYTAAPKYDEPGTRQFVFAAPSGSGVDRRAEIYRDTFLGPWTAQSFGAWPVSDGYVVEAFVDAQALGRATWTLSAGGAIGFDFAHNVGWDDVRNGACDRRMIQYYQRIAAMPTLGPDKYPFQSVEAFCRPTLRAP